LWAALRVTARTARRAALAAWGTAAAIRAWLVAIGLNPVGVDLQVALRPHCLVRDSVGLVVGALAWAAVSAFAPICAFTTLRAGATVTAVCAGILSTVSTSFGAAIRAAIASVSAWGSAAFGAVAAWLIAAAAVAALCRTATRLGSAWLGGCCDGRCRRFGHRCSDRRWGKQVF